MLEMIVFADERAAFAAGFKGGKRDRHPQDQNILAWWPRQGTERLIGLRLGRVSVTDHAGRTFYGRGDSEARDFREGLHYLRRALIDAPMIWMEL